MQSHYFIIQLSPLMCVLTNLITSQFKLQGGKTNGITSLFVISLNYKSQAFLTGCVESL